MVERDSTMETKATFAITLPRIGHYLQRPTCKHCGKTGPEESKCFEIIGYRDGWITRGGGRGHGRGRGIRGGRASAGQGQEQNTTYATHTNADDHATVNAERTNRTLVIPGFTANQVQRLLSIIDAPKTSGEKLSGNGNWLLDSGASCHMTGDMKKLSRTPDICPILVNMPNGQRSIASKQGMVKLSSTITLSMCYLFLA